VTGQEHLKEVAGPVLVIANHSSHIDTISIVHALPPELSRTLAIAAAADYFYRHKVAGSALSLLLNTFPFSRGGHVNESLERCGELIDRGWSILIYPEGTRSPDGTLLPFKSGIGVLAKGLNVPIVPVAVGGGRAILPKGARWPRRAPVCVRIGASLRVDPNASPAEITEQLRDCVLELMEQSK
jgi:long-chain acyl-CoA synthetase